VATKLQGIEICHVIYFYNRIDDYILKRILWKLFKIISSLLLGLMHFTFSSTQVKQKILVSTTLSAYHISFILAFENTFDFPVFLEHSVLSPGYLP